MPRKPKVFGRSSSDMKAERQAERNALRPDLEPFLYEEFGASRGSPKDLCRVSIRDTDVFLGVLGAKYGSPYQEESLGDESVVEWEFKTARGFKRVEIMMFIKESSSDDE